MCDLVDGGMFARLCSLHGTHDANGLEIYTAITVLYSDSMLANKKASNTVAVAFCGNLERRLRGLSQLACPVAVYRGSHHELYPLLG